MKLFQAILKSLQERSTVREESFVEKLKQLGAEIGRAIGAVTGSPQPVPIPVRVEK